ncbi:DUF1741-domain-containing protein [Neurospora crassa]|uniref:Armadillo-like helical domain-containing protein n=2 Tax=Neurospora crassa TaxID=5141 RepID=F5HBF0_NEUCR|nr:hypothetical protein NCU08708 [Neurospora crassa OR74A]EAA34333.2 hypothetical protein NCU08708 [Neurospora crassa OR74A]KHE82917.1 DUF1741-domain-containing protein [Neurospora crassa]CAB99385.2 conserved hypothetical protein [Neurospora crassa]|eukprot:XP_963569.2 hypothetical protein NCU08708 [Neurospora crassa OR74A]
MEQSPLTQQPRPEAFQAKIVQLYQELFKDHDHDEDLDSHYHSPTQTEGFWAEFFILKPARSSLRQILDPISASDLLHLYSAQTQQLFSRAVSALKPTRPSSSASASSQTQSQNKQANALDTLSVFLVSILGKKYTNPSSDIIEVLAGLDSVDHVFGEFVGALDGIVRGGSGNAGATSIEVRRKAVEVAMAVTAGAWGTGLGSYFIQRDMFPALMKLIQDSETTQDIVRPFTLVGLLANYNKFEFQNPYQMRLNDFVNEQTIQKIIRAVGEACLTLRGQYVAVQEDLPEGWSIAGTLSMIGLVRLNKHKKPVYDAETQKRMFSALPGKEAAVLLATYDFTHANKLFCHNLVTLPPLAKGDEPPFSSFLSITSYMLQHAHLSQRTTLYSHLNLMIIRLLIEDPVLCKRLCSSEPEHKHPVRLCRQRSPYLPHVSGDRVLATAVLDTMIDAVNHNLRRRLDVGLYTLCVGILLRLISYMSRSRSRLEYHWHELFRSLLSLIRFLTTYASDLKTLLGGQQGQLDTLLDLVVNTLALGLSSGESFLPTSAAYDDLFYKIVEMGDVLVKFRDVYGLKKRQSNSIDTLVNVSAHYKDMLASGASSSKEKLTSVQVAEVIKQGYETLSIQAKEGLDSWERFREADERGLLKKMAREAVGDVRALVGGE